MSAPHVSLRGLHFPHHHPGAPSAKCPKFKWILGPPTAHILHPPARAQLPPRRTPSTCGCAVWPLWKTRLPPEPLGLPPATSPRHTVCPQSRSSGPRRRTASGQDGLSPSACPGPPGQRGLICITAVRALPCGPRVPVERPADGRCLLCLGPSCSSGGHAVMSGLGEHCVCPQGSGHAAPPHIPPGSDAAPAP